MCANHTPAQSFYCRVEKRLTRLAHNQEIAGSTPAPANIYFPCGETVSRPAVNRLFWGQNPAREQF